MVDFEFLAAHGISLHDGNIKNSWSENILQNSRCNASKSLLFFKKF